MGQDFLDVNYAIQKRSCLVESEPEAENNRQFTDAYHDDSLQHNLTEQIFGLKTELDESKVVIKQLRTELALYKSRQGYVLCISITTPSSPDSDTGCLRNYRKSVL